MGELKILSVSVNYNIVYQEGDTQLTFGDSAYLPFSNDQELNKALTEKPYFAGIVPALVSQMKKMHDPTNGSAKKLIDQVSATLKK